MRGARDQRLACSSDSQAATNVCIRTEQRDERPADEGEVRGRWGVGQAGNRSADTRIEAMGLAEKNHTGFQRNQHRILNEVRTFGLFPYIPHTSWS